VVSRIDESLRRGDGTRDERHPYGGGLAAAGRGALDDRADRIDPSRRPHCLQMRRVALAEAMALQSACEVLRAGSGGNEGSDCRSDIPDVDVGIKGGGQCDIHTPKDGEASWA
jgi:hypothetical protein